MGQLLTKIYSYTAREMKIYNIERRAEKIISKDKPTPAPMYPSTIKELERLNEENVSKEYLQKKDKQLDENLKKVYVSTPNSGASDLNRREGGVRDDRPLPLKRSAVVEPLYGYSESEEVTVPEGRVTLKQALQLIADHRRDPQAHTNTTIAAQYKLPITLTDDILEHFKMFDLHINKKETDPETLTSYERLQKRVKEMNFVNISDIVKEFPQFKNKPFIKNLLNSNDEEKDKSNLDKSRGINLNNDKGKQVNEDEKK